MNNNVTVKKVTYNGLSFGCALAMVISYVKWHSIGWAIVHGFFSWFYVLYYILKYQRQYSLTKAGLLDKFYLLLGLEASDNDSFELRLIENNYDTDEKIELTDDQKETLSSVLDIIKEKLSA